MKYIKKLYNIFYLYINYNDLKFNIFISISAWINAQNIKDLLREENIKKQ